jgi:hypothetical protein
MWNHVEAPPVSLAPAWAAFASQLDALRDHSRVWAQRTAQVGELAGNLARFCLDKLK